MTSGRGFVHLDVRFISSKIYFVAKRSGGSARHTRLSASYESSRIGEGCVEEPIARHMRLLDLIAHGCCARVCAENGQQLPGADQFSETLRNCPLRYVLSDDLTRCATQLAFAEGDRVGTCLDLIHIPAHSVWVEWAEEPRREALQAIPSLGTVSDGSAKHGGALLTVSSNCRSGQIRTFWSSPQELAYVSPIITTFDLDGPPAAAEAREPAIWRGEAFLRMEEEPAIDELLAHLRYHMDEGWAEYYHPRCATLDLRNAVVRRSLDGCAFDAPMLMAFFLLLSARDLVSRQEVHHERLNRARFQRGKKPLLEHVEIRLPWDKTPEGIYGQGGSTRSSPRFHHVRGHIVRRGQAVFWRSPHMRGSARLGQIRSRTVVLEFGQSTMEAARGA